MFMTPISKSALSRGAWVRWASTQATWGNPRPTTTTSPSRSSLAPAAAMISDASTSGILSLNAQESKFEAGSLSELEQPLQAAKRKRDSAQPQIAKRKRDSAQPQIAKRKRDSAQPQILSGCAERALALICVRCRIRRELSSKESRRCMVERLSHITRSPACQTLHHTDASSVA